MSGQSAAIVRGVTLQLISRVLSLPVGIVTLSLASHYLGVHGYGVLTTAVVFTGLFDTFTELGIGTIIVRRVAAGAASLSYLVRLNLALSIGYAAPLSLCASIVGILVYNGQRSTQVAVVILCVGLAFTTLTSCLEPVFDVQVRYGAVAASEFASRIVTLAGTAAVVFTDTGLLMMCAVQVLPQLVRILIVGFAARRLIPLTPLFDIKATWDLVRESLPITLMIAIGVAYWRADGVLLSILSDPLEIGIYGIALQLSGVFNLVPQIFSRSALSTFARGFATDLARLRTALDGGYRFMLLCAVPIAVLGWPLASRLVVVIASPAFSERASLVLQLFFIAVASGFLSPLVSDALIAGRQERFLTTLSVVSLGVNIAINIALIPTLGAVGTGIALIATNVGSLIISQIRLYNIGLGVIPVQYLLRLVPALVMGLCAIGLTWKLPLIIPIAVAGSAYAFGAFVGGAVSSPMRSALRAAIRRAQNSVVAG